MNQIRNIEQIHTYIKRISIMDSNNISDVRGINIPMKFALSSTEFWNVVSIMLFPNAKNQDQRQLNAVIRMAFIRTILVYVRLTWEHNTYLYLQYLNKNLPYLKILIASF